MRSFEDLFNDGLKLLMGGQPDKAAEVFDALVEATVSHPKAIAALGTCYGRMNKPGAGMALLQYACHLAPDDPDGFVNYGATFTGGIHRDIKRQALRRALELQPDSPVAHSNMAGTYVQDGNPQPGVMHGRKAVKLDPNLSAGHSNLSLCLLEQGKWKDAWPHFRGHRWTVIGGYPRKYEAPEWKGEEVGEIVVHGEQGLGDEIMFLAAVADVLPRVRTRLILEVAPRISRLVRRSFRDPRIEVISEEKQVTGKLDAWVAMGDLPAILYPDQAPPRRTHYILPDQDRVAWWRDYLRQFGPPPYIALAHYGGMKHTHEVVRNPMPQAWKPLLSKGTVVSLQYGDKGAERAAQVGVPHIGLAAHDVDEQAAMIAASDVLVSVAQTALHIGGAMGHPVIGIIGNKPAWRYGLTGPMPWYGDNVQLERQGPNEAWTSLVERAAARIEAQLRAA